MHWINTQNSGGRSSTGVPQSAGPLSESPLSRYQTQEIVQEFEDEVMRCRGLGDER